MHVLAIDAGNSKTIALIARTDGRIVGAGRSGGGDIYGVGEAAAYAAHAEAARLAMMQAGVSTDAIRAYVLSAAGADWPEDFDAIRAGSVAHGLPSALVVNDAMGGLRAGSPDGTGVVVVCGTGSAIGAKANDGRIWHSSFWIGAFGGGPLGDAAIRAMVREALGHGPPTRLTQALQTHFELESAEAVLHHLTRRGSGIRPRTLSRLVLDAAAAGDAVALSIARDQADALGDYAITAARRVGLDAGPFALVLSGGVLRHSSGLIPDGIVARVRAAFPQAQPVRAKFEPAVGALFLALESLGVPVDDSVFANARATMPVARLFETP